MKAKTFGSGWHKQSVRHSNARKYGHAGGKYSKSVTRYNDFVKQEEEARKEHERLQKQIAMKGYKKGDFVIYKMTDGSEYVGEYEGYPYVHILGTSFNMPTQPNSGEIVRLATRKDVEDAIKKNKEYQKKRGYGYEDAGQKRYYEEMNRRARENTKKRKMGKGKKEKDEQGYYYLPRLPEQPVEEV